MASHDVVAVLDIVVERAIDERDLTERESDAREPVVVEGLPRHVGERQSDVEELTAEERRGAGDGVDQEERREIVWLFARSVQYDGANSSPSEDTIAMSA